MIAFITIAEMQDVLRAGGPVMYGLALVAALIYTSGFSSILFLWRGNLNIKNTKQFPAWVIDPESAKGRAGEVIRYTQSGDRISAKRIARRFDEVKDAILTNIDRRVILMNTLVAAAPLCGLLGTVTGMLSTFLTLATGSDSESISNIASGIKEALITTQTGLMVALPGVFVTMLIKQKRRQVAAAIERIEILTLLHRVENQDITKQTQY